jgi:hypothetical protein
MHIFVSAMVARWAETTARIRIQDATRPAVCACSFALVFLYVGSFAVALAEQNVYQPLLSCFHEVVTKIQVGITLRSRC